jgi:hypothetical protein
MKVGVMVMMQAVPQPQQKSVAMSTSTAGLRTTHHTCTWSL